MQSHLEWDSNRCPLDCKSDDQCLQYMLIFGRYKVVVSSKNHRKFATAKLHCPQVPNYHKLT